jgi:amidohydrolase
MEVNLKEIIDFRKELHQYPEVSGKEVQTQKRIIDRLRGIGANAETIGRTGVYSLFQGKEAGKTILLRADIDALPIREINDFSHRSQYDGIAHKCGHDGHTAIMYGVAQYLTKIPIQKGKVILLFQPAEENGQGAREILSDPKFTFKPDFVFAFHNLPGYPLHQVVMKAGAFNAAVKSVVLKLSGKTSHAAEPEHGINPALAMAELIQCFDQIVQPDINRNDFALAVPVYATLGEPSYGINAGHGELHYTLRCWNNETMKALTDQVVQNVDEITKRHNLSHTMTWIEEFTACHNDQGAVQLIRRAASKNHFEVHERPLPFKWGEDFGLFTQKYRGAMFGIGSGEECPALHNPDYDFPDAIIPTGIDMFTRLIREIGVSQ